jgi:electron-transferring-flavoprotein dehydrogenase
VPRIKGTHTAMKSGMLAAEAAVEALAAGREHDSLTSYQTAYENSWIYKELRIVRNVLPLVEKYGNLLGSALAGVNMWLENFGIRMPFTMKHHPDHKALKKKSAGERIEYPKPDGVFSFDRLSSVFLSNTNHAEDQPIHLQVKDMDLQKNSEFMEFAGPSARYCPAGVYEWIEEEGKDARYQINSQNCVHCKTCDIKDPNQNINWVTPEGGGGPNYPNM